jgi:hypothetical protein
MHARGIRVIVNILLVLVATVMTLVVLESAVRLMGTQKHFAVTVNTWDRVTGTRQIPGATGFVVCPEYEMDLIINSKGLRDREFAYAKPARTIRMLCLGDSFTCGYGVQAKQTFPKVLEALLNQQGGTSATWQVLNAGIGSTGTAHQLAFFQSEGYKYDPDFLLVCFFPGNDFWDNIISGLYSMKDKGLVKHDAPKTGGRTIQQVAKWIPGYTTFFAKSHLLNLIKYRVSRYHYRELAERQVLPESESAVEEQEEELTRRLFLAMRDACEARGCSLIVTAIPSPESWGLSEEGQELTSFLEDNGIRFVDISGSLQRASERGLRVNYEHDGHWTPAGHKAAAQALYRYFHSISGSFPSIPSR